MPVISKSGVLSLGRNKRMAEWDQKETNPAPSPKFRQVIKPKLKFIVKEVYNYTIPSLSKFNVIGQFWIHNIFIRICIEVVKLVLTEFLIFTHMVHFMALNKLFFFNFNCSLLCSQR